MRPFHVIVKPAGAACNLHCRYCFFLQKASLSPGSDLRMGEDVLEACVRDVLAAHPGQRSASSNGMPDASTNR